MISVSDEVLDLDVLPVEARRAMGVVLPDELRPVMEIAVERRTATVHRDNPTGPDLIVEAVADRGSVKAGENEEEFAECETGAQAR